MKQYTDKQIEELEQKWFENGLAFAILFGLFFGGIAWIIAYECYN